MLSPPVAVLAQAIWLSNQFTMRLKSFWEWPATLGAQGGQRCIRVALHRTMLALVLTLMIVSNITFVLTKVANRQVLCGPSMYVPPPFDALEPSHAGLHTPSQFDVNDSHVEPLGFSCYLGTRMAISQRI